MATETGPDLTFARQQVEALMDDTCRVVRPAVLDAAGLAAAPVVYSDGRCSVRDNAGARDTTTADDGYRFPYSVGLPATEADAVREGDVLIVTSSRRDPTLVALTLIVRHVKRGTFLVSRRLGCERFVTERREWHDEEAGP